MKSAGFYSNNFEKLLEICNNNDNNITEMKKNTTYIILLSIFLNSAFTVSGGAAGIETSQLAIAQSQTNELLAIADLPVKLAANFIKQDIPLFPEFNKRDGNKSPVQGDSKCLLLNTSKNLKDAGMRSVRQEAAAGVSQLLFKLKSMLNSQAPPGFGLIVFLFLLSYLVSLRKGNIPGDMVTFLSKRNK